MNWFDNIKIRYKLLAVFGMLVCITISFAAFTIAQTIRLSDDISELINSYRARQLFVAEATADLNRLRVADLSKGYLSDGGNYQSAVSGFMVDYNITAESFLDNLNGFEDIVKTDTKLTQSERQVRIGVINGIQDAFARYLEATAKLDSATAGADKRQALKHFEDAMQLGGELSQQMQKARDMVFATTTLKATETTKNAARILNVIYAVAAGSVLLSAFLLLITVNNINQPISVLETAVTEISRGNLGYPIRSERKDELGALSVCISNMVTKISEHHKTMAIMDNLDSMVYVTDFDYNLLFVNQRLAEIFDLDREKCIGQKCFRATRGRVSPCPYCLMSQLAPYKDSLPSQDFEAAWDEYLKLWVGGTSSAIRWVDGSVVNFSSVRDVTEKKRQNELLQDALTAAKTASIAKSSFLANMSHEIRTPMNAILGITEVMLRDEALNPASKEGLDKIYSSGDLLLNIINEILDLSKIEAGKMELVGTKYEVASLINDTIALNMMRIGSKPIEFSLSVDQGIPSSLIGDSFRIKQILNNLLSNAFKYTEKGMVKLDVSQGHQEDSQTSLLVFAVSDTGQGMTDEQVSLLFDEYSRFNQEVNIATEGTGLGMNITRNLVHMMNGKITVKSELGSGSVFTVCLPQEKCGSGTLGKELAESLSNFSLDSEKPLRRAQVVFEPMPYGSILIVDDVESNLYVARGLMQPYGLSIETAQSGFEAIEKIKAGKIYDIIFMDHMMPKMDGIEATSHIRSLGYALPIVALSANAVVGQSEIFLSSGFDDFISKPIDLRHLNLLLNKLIRDKQPPEVIASANLKKPATDAGGASQEDTSAFLQAMDQIEGINTEIALARFSGIEKLYRDAAMLLHKMLAGECKKMDSHLEAKDTKNFEIRVHAMKSSLSTIGAMNLSEAAAKLESASASGDIGRCLEQYPSFKEKLMALHNRLTSIFPETASQQTRKLGDCAMLSENIRKALEAAGCLDMDACEEAVSRLLQCDFGEETNGLIEQASAALGDFQFGEAGKILGKIGNQART